MANCDISITNLDPSCEALNKQGGIKKKFWIGKFDEVTTTLDGDGYVDTVTLVSASPVNKLIYVIGKAMKNNTQTTGVFGENVNTFNQIVNAILYFYSPEERKAIEELVNAGELVVFMQTESGQVEMYGYDKGVKASAFDALSGTLANDNTAGTLTFSGEQYGLAKVLKIGSDLQDIIDALDALT